VILSNTAKKRADRGGFVRAGELPLLKDLAEGLKQPAPEQDQQKSVTAAILAEAEVIDPNHIAYVPTIFLQCFLPLRHNQKNKLQWKVGNGGVKLLIRAGALVDPKTGDFKECVVPAGPKARIVTAYINDYAYRHKTPEIDLGENLHQAMRQMNVAVGGRNAKELCREVENIAAAEINMGFWLPDGSAHQRVAKVAEDVSFWIEKNPNQRTIWQPTMTLSQRYYASIQESQHIAPVYWPALVALQHNARAMDIFAFLCYRLRTIPVRRPVTLRADILHSMFGRDIKQRKHFWPEFIKALGEAVQQYPQARHSISILEDKSGMRLGYAEPLIPHKKIGRIV